MAKKDKNLQKVTARLTELSRGADGRIDEKRVRVVLAEVGKAFPPAQLRPILEVFYAAVARELRFSEARIEYAGTLATGTANAIAAHFSEIYNRPIIPVSTENAALLGGLRVQVGDDVYDASLAGTLARLRASLASA
ncbi:MAG: F0F1 ATP synthase subunit delta [Opitutales bacterium]|nr:F0F1 ATP synthase subunit delta [Opitutales bacterium]